MASREAILRAWPAARLGRRAPRTSDASLVRAAKGGSPDAMEAIVRAHWSAVHRAALLVVHDAGAAEDVAQETFISAARGMHRFDERRPIAPWLHAIAVNRAVDRLRDRARRAEVPLGNVSLEDRDEPVPATSLPDELLRALRELDAEDRAIVVLRHLFDYRGPEIAQLLDLPPSTVRTRLQRALERVRASLEEER